MFLALRDLRFARGRFGLMAAVVGLISLLVVLLSGLAAGLSGQSVSAVRSLPADHLSFAQPAEGQDVSFAASHVSTQQAEPVAAADGVRRAALLGVTTVRLDMGDHDARVTAFGAEPGSFAAPASLAPGTVVVSSDLAETEGLESGQAVTMDGEDLRVAGTREDSSFNHLPVVWMPLTQWQRLDAAGGADATVVASQTAEGFDAQALDHDTALSTTDLDGALAAVGSYSAENGSLSLMRVLLMAVGALVVGAFFTVWTIQRTPDLAVLKALGASTAYLVRDALAQALVVLVVGGGTGTLLAAALGLVASGTVPFVVSASTTLVPSAGLLAVGMVGAAASLRRVATVDPLTALGAAR